MSPAGAAWIRRLQREGLYAVVALVLATLWGLIVWASVNQRQRLIEDSARELEQLDRAVAQHTAGLLDRAASDLRTIELWLRARAAPAGRPERGGQDGDGALGEPHFVALVDEMRRASGGLVDVHAVTADGRVLALPSQDPGRAAGGVAHPAREALPEPGARAPRIGDPVGAAGQWMLPLGWRLATPLAGLQGLVATIDLQRLGALHERMRLKPDGSVALVRLDGRALARAPADVPYVGRDLSAAATFRAEYGAKPRGSFLSDGTLTDGMPRLVSYERLDGHPVTVLVTRGLDGVLRRYEERRRIAVAIAAALSLLLLAFTSALRRSLRELHRAKGELRVQAATDELTGTLNRRALFEAAAREFERAQRYGRPMAVLMLDADHFKRINDLHGHAGGDAVLRHMGALWQSMLRGQDLLARIGGEEFCIVLPETAAEAAAHVAERLRQGLAAAHVVVGSGAHAGVTASVGWSVVHADDADWQAALARADRALYRAKADGRDCVRAEGVVQAGTPARAGGAAAVAPAG